MLWAAFTIAFYRFLQVSEYTTLHWSDVSVTEEKLAIKLHQSKTDPFRRGHTIDINPTNSSTCPPHAFQLYSKNVTPTNTPSKLVFSAGKFSPLSHDKLNTVLRQ